jgi:hypothetical protein
MDAAAALFMALMQHLTAVLDSRPAGAALDEETQTAIVQATNSILRIVRDGVMPLDASQVQQMPNVVKALRVLVFVVYVQSLQPPGSDTAATAAAAAAAGAAAAAAAQQQGRFA